MPHPFFAERRFVLQPLAEIAPERCPEGWDERLEPAGITRPRPARARADTMTGVRTFEVDDCAADLIVAAKGGRTVSVCIPCRDEAATIGPLVSVIRAELMGAVGIVDELIVLDDRSTDDTARVAAHAGARVVSIDDVHAVHGKGHGKGNALWATLLVSHGDFVVWCDGDVTSFEPELGGAAAVAAARRRLGRRS